MRALGYLIGAKMPGQGGVVTQFINRDAKLNIPEI